MVCKFHQLAAISGYISELTKKLFHLSLHQRTWSCRVEVNSTFLKTAVGFIPIIKRVSIQKSKTCSPPTTSESVTVTYLNPTILASIRDHPTSPSAKIQKSENPGEFGFLSSGHKHVKNLQRLSSCRRVCNSNQGQHTYCVLHCRCSFITASRQAK